MKGLGSTYSVFKKTRHRVEGENNAQLALEKKKSKWVFFGFKKNILNEKEKI